MLIFAHRGSTQLAPENTREAFDLALKLGADVLETDVRVGYDGSVFVTHDATLERTTNGTGLVKHRDADYLSRLDAGARFVDANGGSYANRNIRLICLQDLLQEYAGVKINIDIKDSDPEAAVHVAKVLQQHAEKEVTVGSFHEGVVQRFGEIAPDIATAATRTEVARLYFNPGKPGPLPFQTLQIPTRYWMFNLARKPFIERMQMLGLTVTYWTINDTASMRKLVLAGANGLVTDRTDLAAALLREMNLRR